jgi:hypothetical protein
VSAIQAVCTAMLSVRIRAGDRRAWLRQI